MNKILLFLLAISLLTNCNNLQNTSDDKNDLSEWVPEPDKAERLKYEAIQALKKSGCVLANPDTSISGIKLRNPESTRAVIGTKDQADSLEHYHYFSIDGRETLTLTQHLGDKNHQISILKVEYSTKKANEYRQLKIDTFKTEKGIKLGMTKQQVIDRLGTCYAALDSTKEYIELYYTLQTPNDSKTKILTTNNMPVYYASYKLWNDKLKKFEFGFERP